MSRIVGYASDPDPLAAEVVCLPCWDELTDHWHGVYGHRVRAELAHLTVCAHCGAEPGDDAPEVDR